MIASIEGKIILKEARFVVLEVGGVGYKVFLSLSSIAKVKLGEIAKFWTHLHVREDAMELYGFWEKDEMEFFENLISISGIGPKSALGIISLAPAATLKKAISSGDTSYLTKVSGIGRKTAEKIILELKDKFAGAQAPIGAETEHDPDILDALISLGYTQKEARDMIQRIPSGIKGRENRLKEALRK
ncbi:MAG: Holliday junction branch migration protein RuvA [Patescibacteria group bacterium]